MAETNKIFTEEEIRRLERMPHVALIEEMEAGRYDKALLWCENLCKLYRYTFDLRVRWDDQLSRCIFDNLGADGIYDVMRWCSFRKKDLEKLRITPEDEQTIKDLIRDRDIAACRKWIDKQYKMFRTAHDIRIEWETVLMTFIYEHIGHKALFDVMETIMVPAYYSRISEIANSGFDMRVRVIRCIWGLHSHGESITIKEDDEKVSIWADYCGSGTYLLDRGVYGPPLNCALCHDLSPNTYCTDNFPIYCSHSPVQEMASVDLIGFPMVIKTPWDECDEPDYMVAKRCCHSQLYKDPKFIPDRVYQMLGKKRPSTYYFPGYKGFDFTPDTKAGPGLGDMALYFD